MKKIIFALVFVLGLGTVQAQQVISSSGNTISTSRGDFSNEVKLNFLNLIALGSIEAGYEKYLSEDHSLDFQVHINDRFGFNSQGSGKEYKTNSLQAGMNFYFGNGLNGRFHLFPLAKLRFGEFEEPGVEGVITTNMNSFMIGLGGGYKWELSSNFAFGPFVSVARNFSDEVSNRFTRIELNGGFSLGYRF
ncbi:DUF3575 domain-containing protein [Algoriphagus hitonicola]|uniref:Outer membrane protein beta-barrel domain-containing protein n=1 Tax=Algoriphagus hitonicola TaxID=435880 RepID=A0A1I2WA48_9BACT|nr:DUF3575 domain-containing protein [Algoriphagus hitonicola]SFG98235.1 hypothetical protein SAMN04487988_11227 [Algoriphagus hitonicola]